MIFQRFRQFLIILAFAFFGEVMHSLVPLPIPASIYGLLFFTLALMLRLIPLSAVKETGSFLAGALSLFFVAPAVNLVDAWPLLREHLLPVLLIIVLTTVVTFLVSGSVTAALLRREKGGSHE